MDKYCDIDISSLSISEFSKLVSKLNVELNDKDFEIFVENALSDSRAGITKAINKELKIRKAIKAEAERVSKMYQFDQQIAGIPGSVVLGLDEVGRGPLAGPLTVGGVILPKSPEILNINDSKKLTANQRETISKKIFDVAKYVNTVSVSPDKIDAKGMSDCLRFAFGQLIQDAHNNGFKVDVVLLDGNPMHLDSREVNVIKGDSKSASIACASIVAKVTRDTYMETISEKYKEYCFAQNKGYGTSQHIDAIKKFGLTPVHRKSFCTSFMQMSLF